MEKVDVSSKALFRWAAWVLSKKGVSLQDVSELGDGNKLARLVEGATSKTLPMGERSGGGGGGVAVGAKGVQNTFVLYSILAFLSSEGIQIPQSCSPQVLAAGNQEQIVGLLKRLAWQYLIMAFAAKETRRAADGGLIAWATQKLHNHDHVVSHKTLYNGEVVLALIELATGAHALQSTSYSALDAEAKARALTEGFEAAQTQLDIPQVVDASDFVYQSIDLTSLLVYLALLRRVLDGKIDSGVQTNAVATKANQATSAGTASVPPLQTDRVENNMGPHAAASLGLQQRQSTPREIAEMKQKMAEKDRELEEMKRKMEQSRREAEEEMRRLVEEIKAMKEKEKLSSANSSIRSVSDLARSTSLDGEEEAASASESSPPSSPEPLRPARPDRKVSSGTSQRKISPSPLATSSSSATPSSPSASLRSSLSSRPSLPHHHASSSTSASSSPSSSPYSSPATSSSANPLRASPPKSGAAAAALPLPPLELQIEKIAAAAEPGLGGNHGALPTSPTTGPSKGAYARQQQQSAGGKKNSKMLDHFIGHFEREMEFYEQEKAQQAAAVQNQQPAEVEEDEEEEEAIARERKANEEEMARLKREVETQLAELEMEAQLGDTNGQPTASGNARNARSSSTSSSNGTGKSPASSPQSSGSSHAVATPPSPSVQSRADQKGKQKQMTMRELVPKLCTDQAKTPPMDFMSPRTAEEIYTKIPSCYPLGDDDGDADVLLDTILMQIDLDRKKGQMSPRDKEDYEDYMREKRMVDKRKQHLLDEGLSAAFPPSPEELRRRDAGPMKMATPTSSSEDIIATAGVVRQRSHSSFSSTESPTTRSRANTYHISELVLEDDYDHQHHGDVAGRPRESPRDADHPTPAAAVGDKDTKKKKEKKKEKEKKKKNNGAATMTSAGGGDEVDEKQAKRKKRNSLTSAFGSLKVKGTSSKEKRMSGAMRTTSFSSRFLPRSSSRSSDDPDKPGSPSASPKTPKMPKEPKKERSWRDLRSSFSFSSGSKGKVSKSTGAGISSPRGNNKMRKAAPDDPREGVKGVMIGLYDFQARKEDEISFNRGDLIYLMSDLDETGWALGKIKPRKRRMYESESNDERIGLFPVEFVRVAKEGEEQQADDAEDEDLLPPLPSSESQGSFSSSSSNLSADSSPPKPQLASSSSSSLPLPGGVDAVADGAQGWLYFKHSSKKWLSHHFVLTKDWLTYYKNQKPDKKPLGKIPLAQAWLEVSRALDEKQKKVHCILIATPAGKTYYMHAANRVDLEAWLDAFRNTTTIAGLRQM